MTKDSVKKIDKEKKKKRKSTSIWGRRRRCWSRVASVLLSKKVVGLQKVRVCMNIGASGGNALGIWRLQSITIDGTNRLGDSKDETVTTQKA